MSQFVEEITLKANDKASNVLAGLTSNLRGLMGQIAGMAGIAGTGFGFGAMVKEGLEFNKMLDDSRIAIAAVVGSLHTYRDASGAVIKGEAAWSAALADSARVQEKLRTAALTTTATYSEMVEAFQVGVGPMTRAGIALDDTAEATQRLTQVAAAASIPMAQLAVEIRQFFNGDVMRGRLLQTLQITKEQIEEHKKLGDMMDFVRLKTETYARAAQAAADTMTGRWSNLKDAIQQTLGIGMEPLYAKLKEAMGAMSEQFVTFGKDSKGNLTAAFSPEVVARVQAMGVSLTAALDRFKEMIPAVVDFGLAVGEHVSKAIDLLSRLPFKEILSVITDLIKVTNGWGLALAGAVHVAGGFKAVSAMFVALPATLHSASLALDGMALRINAATGASIGLSQAFAGLGAGLAAGGALWGIQKIIEGLHVARELLDEWKAANAAEGGTGRAIEQQLERFQGAYSARVGPQTMAQLGTSQAISGTLEIVRKELTETGKVSEETRQLYLNLLKDIKATNPNFKESPLLRAANDTSDALSEVAGKYAALLATLRADVKIEAMGGLDRTLAEISEKFRKVREGYQKSFEGVNLSEALALSIEKENLEKFRAASKVQGKVYAGIVQTDLEKTLAQYKGGEALVEGLIGGLEKKRGDWRRAIERIFSTTPDSASAGAQAGAYGIFAALPSAAESAANAVQGVWQGMARAFDDSFYSVLTGRLDSLKDVFKSLWESVMRTFSQYLSDMLQRWIATQIKMGETSQLKALPGATSYGADGTTTTYTSGGLPQGGYTGAATGAGIGLGVGSLVGQLGNGKYNQTGGMIGGALGGAIGGGSATLGAALGGWAGPIGAIVGALIGTLIGALLSPNTMQHVRGSLGAMMSKKEWIPDEWVKPLLSGGGPRVEGQPWTPPVYGDPEFVKGHWDYGQQARTELEVTGKEILDTQSATFADLFRIGAKEQSRDLLATYRASLKASLTGATFDINAGSSATIQQATEYFTTKLLPRIGLSAAFGQTGYLPTGNQDLPGGVGNISYRAPGMNADGTWAEKKLFSEDSPLFKMMVGIKDASGAYADGLGFTVEKFAELAARISTDDPEKLLAYITGIVGVVVGLRDLGAEMGKTFGELTKGWADEAAAGPTAAFAEQAQSVAELFDNLDLYSGDEQLKKAQEAQAASDQLWQSVVSYLQQLDALAEKLSAGLQGMREKMRDFLSPLSEAGAVAATQATIDETWGKLLNATNSGQIESATNEAAAAIEALFNIMAERITRGKALLDKIATLDTKLGSIGAEVALAQLERENPLKAWGQEMVGIQAKIAAAARLSGIDQIAALEDVGTSAEEMYQNLSGFLSEIASVSASINKSFGSQIWELGVGEMDAAGQATAVTDRIRELQQQLKIATSPAEISAIAAEIQSLTTRYVGTFGKDDPNRAEAIAWAQAQLEDSRAIAEAALKLMQTEAEKLAGELRGMLMGSTGLITTNINEASAAIGQLSQTLSELDRVVREQLERLGTSALDALEPLRTAMDGAAGIFTGATGDVVDALTAPDVGLEDSAKRVSGAFDGASAAIGRFVTKLDGVAINGAAPSSKQVTTSKGGASPTQIVATVRRYAGALTPRVG